MGVTANARGRTIVGELLAGHVVGKRRSLDSDARPCTDCISRKPAPLIPPIASDKPSEAEAIQRAPSGDRPMFDCLYCLHSRRVYALCLRMVGNTAETEDRNVLRGPGRTNLDLSLAKTTPLYRQRITLELRADAFNVLNHAEFNNLDNDGQDIGSTFGQVTGVYDPRILQSGTHIRF